ncbi:MAG TPA: hypothetical protein VG938_16485 [Verrucomicrobiae bacterium]|nr:hypothetical protein [Verrucomicrobiae bacterium]
MSRHLGSHGWRSFCADVDTYEDGETFERLRLWISTYTGAEVCLNLCEDKHIWVCLAALPKSTDSFKIDFHPDFALLGSHRLVDALVETVSISTRLNYDESPEPLLREIWNFSGEVNIEGII